MSNTKDKIQTLNQVQDNIQKWQQNGEKVVFTNGCFDILHLGHVDYLEKARQKGQRLVVGLNSDDSVKRLKGENRPINSEYARARLLASLGFTDAIIIFAEDTPLDLITSLLPDILVKGSDYSVENIVGATEVIANGGSVETIDLVEGYSTTKIIEKSMA